ncbi:PREDICTED: sphingomyelin phosphodiesterase 4 [Ceratosolen solmsi marchali]|uniref:Sphingomyelin phosphodiesterase 4 n=1 Tax=Ceratosolen solmsi marchali TaxID=326594 RepID=A0AAJ6YY36_9HYME|nr:PREDICTED: sphingomyelin phosphodiesterase 4 [Ceratosolen solmsi marchali]
MTSSADVVTGRVQAYLLLPLVQRCKELATLIDELSTTELQHIFPVLIDSLFGISDNIGWGLHTISLKKYPQEYEVLCNFLSPQGPIFSLCYKLLPDCYLKYNFPVSYLPSKIRHMLEEGIIPPFYSDKLRDDHGSRFSTVLVANPFEYYIFHFAYHLTNPWLQIQQQDNVWVNWETVYVELANCYLFHFLPRDNSAVLPIIGPYVKKTPPRKLMQSTDTKRLQTSRLLRTTILSPHSTSPNSTVPQQQCLPQVWRSETIVQVFLDFWLEYTEEEQFSSNRTPQATGSLPRRHSIHSGEHIRLVRTFIKTLHEFANSAIGDKSAMNELKRVILPSVQGKIYTFLRKAIHHWPLDSSFRLILEAWLSFIQPWRYIQGIGYTKKFEDEERGKIHDPNKWISFIANNLLAYTAIFQQLLPRFMRTDLIAPKNAHMLFRVTKVFSQPNLAKILLEVENCIDDMASMRNRSTNQWTGTVRQQILELEGQSYQYIPMFSPATISQVICFLSTIKQAHLTSTSLVEALEKRRTGRRFLISIWEFFNGDDTSSDDISLEERKRVPIFLANAQQQLIEIFQVGQVNVEEIPQSTLVADHEYHESILSTSFCHQSQMDSSLDSSRPGVFVPIQEGRQNCRYIEYMGDPELQPVRSYESAFLVRFFYQLCNHFNTKYQHELVGAYTREDFLGRITRQILKPPTTVVQLPKRTSNGFSSGYEKRLPPHISLRPAANYNFMSGLILGMFIFWLIGYGTTAFIGMLFFAWLCYVLIKAICEPWSNSSNVTSAKRISQMSTIQ